MTRHIIVIYYTRIYSYLYNSQFLRGPKVDQGAR